jgi:phage tail sheath protein FI
MPDYPGVYVEEVPSGIRPIEGVDTSTAAFLGVAERGPLRPEIVRGFADYRRHFGGAAGEGKYLPYAVRGFFENGGRRALICRIAGAGATSAALKVDGLRIHAVGPGKWGNRIFVRLGRSRVEVAYWPELPPGDPFVAAPVAEMFDEVDWNDPAALLGQSALIRVAGVPACPQRLESPLAGGSDGAAPMAVDYRAGLAALDEHDEVALVAAPAAPDEVVATLIEHVARHRFRFAVIDSPQGKADIADLDPRSRWESSRAAYYYPWVFTEDLNGGPPRLVPPSGHVLGVYARTDAERGVWKAPANAALRGASGCEFEVTARVQEILNPRGVNIIRNFPGRGIRVWGARTLSTSSEWKYVNIRRLLIFLERSIDKGTQWVLFEPNDERSWARVRRQIENFLVTLWRDGALMGIKPEQAFCVRCDRATMTQDDIDNGRLIVEIGAAPVRPAEFVIIRIGQWTADAKD